MRTLLVAFGVIVCAIVVFGDQRIVNTVKVVDATLRVDTPRGPVWHRYQGDGYGEHADGRPFDGTGVGRAWPLLTGERAHYELAAGRRDAAKQLADALEALAGESGLLPEQVWDSADIPDRGLFIGHPSGSAVPLVWAHAEYVKLCRSLQEREVFDRPPQTVQRYLVEKVTSRHVIWRFNNKVRAMPPGRTLRIETLAPAVVRWSFDGWRTIQGVATRDTTLGVHVADLETPSLAIWRARGLYVVLARGAPMGRGRFRRMGGTTVRFNDGGSIHRSPGAGSRRGCGRGSRSPSCRAR